MFLGAVWPSRDQSNQLKKLAVYSSCPQQITRLLNSLSQYFEIEIFRDLVLEQNCDLTLFHILNQSDSLFQECLSFDFNTRRIIVISDDEEVRIRMRAFGVGAVISESVQSRECVAEFLNVLHREDASLVEKENDIRKFQRRMIETLSHEFRTPLVSINVGSELLLEQQLPDEQAKSVLRSIARGGARLQRLVEDFLLVQQIESGSLQAVARLKSDCDLKQIISEILEKFDSLYDQGKEYRDRIFLEFSVDSSEVQAFVHILKLHF